MKLYGYWRSSSSWRVRAALSHKGIAYEYVPVHLRRGEQHSSEHRGRNPMRQVPVLEVRESGEVQRLAQSMAIIEYLEERQPAPPLLPAERVARARARQLAEMVNAGIQPAQNFELLNYVERELGGDKVAWSAHWIDRGLVAIEEVAAGTAGRYLVGDALCVADVFLVPQLYNARRFGLEVRRYPTLARVEAACLELPCFVDSHPDRQVDAEPT